MASWPGGIFCKTHSSAGFTMRLSSLISTTIAAYAVFATAKDANTTSSSSNVPPPLPTRPPETTKPGRLVVIDGTGVTFEFSTGQPHSKNWIGIWHDYYGAPVNGSWVQDHLAWAWADGTHGTVEVDIADLPAGRYLAYLLAQKGYKELADPADVYISRNRSMRFIPETFTTHNARVGDAFSADISGLLTNVKNGNMSYAVIPPSNADWVYVTSRGVIRGKPKKSGLSRFSVRATSADNDTAVLPVAVPVAPLKRPLVRNIRVLTLNLWLGGRNVVDYHTKQVSFLASQDVDVVALQESYFQDGRRLAKALGWNVWQAKDVSILSRYPIGRVYHEIEAGGIVRVDLDGDAKQLLVWNVHLNNAPYGPYDLCFTNFSTNYIQRREEWARRVQQVYEIVHRLKEYKERKPEFELLPQILAGDFASPSHLDYTMKTRDLHCKGRDPFPWPVSRRVVLDAKWQDSFRDVFRDPWKVPGNTWSPVRRLNGDRPEPMDRIDFIYHKKLKTTRSDVVVVGDPKPEPYHADNEWTSDHAAVVSEFQLP
ncbi:uncharacterized protein G6M90_00g067350 [Metarhizium brunneum]|uniref:Endonuclease/exonuclease/phosphatase domain-containing protein n=1 Tax=Metarhizium brunneum TaxID=500148 RepID=A0A7D5YSV1_9HYPO|nr:hypothetical protein G6M90_00g067350 [Metarhizium brunneum]